LYKELYQKYYRYKFWIKSDRFWYKIIFILVFNQNGFSLSICL
jgi:hypothetical protein